jgi:regulator of protease activity HflC (stomatin/prohibitin superfamily)
MIAYAVIGIIVVILFMSVKVAKEYERAVVYRLGRLQSLRGPGLYLLLPVIETQRIVDTRTRTVNVETQETITTDSVTVKVNAVLWYKIINPADAINNVADYSSAVYQIALTTLRNIIGQHKLDEILSDRDQINTSIRTIVDNSIAAWGIEIEMVEMKDVEIPEGMQRAMAREAEAIREKRARIIKAQAEQEASEKLMDAAKLISESPLALELRRMQMLSEIGAENNSTTIVLMPADFVNAAHSLIKKNGSAINANLM